MIELFNEAEMATYLVPDNASPVLKSEIMINLWTSYPETLVTTDFTVVLYSLNDTTYERELYVMAANDTEKSLKIKFPGAYSGLYTMQVSSRQHGRIDSDQLFLDVYGRVTSITPSTGSKYGGALITIYGENFSDDPLDNPVMIGENYCYVQTSSPTEITCRTDLLTDQLVGEETFIVFLKTSEEAGTPNGDDVIFTYVEPSANITDVFVEFDESDMTHKVILNGTGFDS
jgi:hypothetical protein